MIQLLMIADDFTGALDAGVQFASHGAKTTVITDTVSQWSQDVQNVDILVVDAETRHMPAQQAYDTVHRIVTQGVQAGIPHIYKKTDSALRGNIGAELSALLHASGEKQLPFLPAFPQIGRCTKQGVHYIQDLPVAQSVFGKDPFEPVKESRVDKLIAGQTQDPVTVLPPLDYGDALPEQEGILVFDSLSERDLSITAHRLMEGKKLAIMAGCAGFAAMLPQLLGTNTLHHEPVLPKLDSRLLVLCGSVNPITQTQLDHAQASGFLRLRMEPRQKLEPDYWGSDQGRQQLAQWLPLLQQGKHTIIDSNDPGSNQPTADYAKAQGLTLEDVRLRISGSLGQILKAISQENLPGTLLVTGGDTLMQCMNCMGIHEIEPLCEVEAGVVLSRFQYQGVSRYVISKSGGFGKADLLISLSCMLSEQVSA
ncbi:MAG TPA: four-carbon acid sugar kinase family protein [Candidatus Faecousia faecavium]|nr:four-carbon acid sugar kinase family protein [Candidatus Faecousia faecavium]